MEKGPSNYAEYWTSDYNEGKHFGKHGEEMGYDNNNEGKEAYSKAAQDFANSESKTLMSFTTDDKTTYLYDPATNEFEVLSKDGEIVTYFEPDRGMEYFLNQFDRYGGTWS